MEMKGSPAIKILNEASKALAEHYVEKAEAMARGLSEIIQEYSCDKDRTYRTILLGLLAHSTADVNEVIDKMGKEFKESQLN